MNENTKHFFAPREKDSGAMQTLPTDPARYILKHLVSCSTKKARAKLDFKLATKYQLLPLSLMGGSYGGERLLLAGSTAAFAAARAELRFLLNCELSLEPQPAGEITQEAIYQAYYGSADRLEGTKGLLHQERQQLPPNLRLPAPGRAAVNTESKYLEDLIHYAIANNASDLHFSIGEQGGTVRIRIDTEIYSHQETILSARQHEILIGRIKVLADMDLSKRLIAQDGAFEFSKGSTDNSRPQAAIRVSTIPTTYGEKAVLRIQQKKTAKNISELGLNPRTLRNLALVCQKQEGLILFCGATGSGKTTSMYAVLTELAKRNLTISTIEDPVEVNFAAADQSSLNIEAGFDYCAALKSVIRQDPDVILIGEIRDPLSATIALQAAQTGHIVLSTVHSADCLQAVRRLELLGCDLPGLASCLSMVIAQKLVPALCPHCEPKQNSICPVCRQSGRAGAALISESICFSKQISAKLAEGILNVHHLKNLGQNYVSFRADIDRLIAAGRIDGCRSKNSYDY